ncbi:MAG: 4Fe-4S binding protein [Lachnospiraceae bacterium]|nr:4Fe-4S binding protein [Lachnospiraceae bacterium]
MIRKAEEIDEKISWQELTTGCEIYEPATSRLVKTGEWRARTPKWIEEKCKQCLLCAPFCPDASIPVREGRRGDFDFDHCKGCGICLKTCPFDAIEWEAQGQL